MTWQSFNFFGHIRHKDLVIVLRGEPVIVLRGEPVIVLRGEPVEPQNVIPEVVQRISGISLSLRGTFPDLSGLGRGNLFDFYTYAIGTLSLLCMVSLPNKSTSFRK